jgi:hypothetical protein
MPDPVVASPSLRRVAVLANPVDPFTRPLLEQVAHDLNLMQTLPKDDERIRCVGGWDLGGERRRVENDCVVLMQLQQVEEVVNNALGLLFRRSNAIGYRHSSEHLGFDSH